MVQGGSELNMNKGNSAVDSNTGFWNKTIFSKTVFYILRAKTTLASHFI